MPARILAISTAMGASRWRTATQSGRTGVQIGEKGRTKAMNGEPPPTCGGRQVTEGCHENLATVPPSRFVCPSDERVWGVRLDMDALVEGFVAGLGFAMDEQRSSEAVLAGFAARP